jgi:hypothetical protein
MTTTNLLLLKVIGLGTLGLSAACNSIRDEEKKPNIVFIMSDDHAWQALSAYNHPISKIAPTPQIDRLANEGMRFDRCLVTNSICGQGKAWLDGNFRGT